MWTAKLLKVVSFECRMYEEIMGEDPDKSSWTPEHQKKVRNLLRDIWNSGVATMYLATIERAVI